MTHPPPKLRMKELGLRFQYKLESNTSYIDTLDTLDDSEDQNYEENEMSIKPTGVYLRKLERRYMEKPNDIEEMNQTQQPPWLVNNILFCYEGEIWGVTTRESITSYNIKKTRSSPTYPRRAWLKYLHEVHQLTLYKINY